MSLFSDWATLKGFRRDFLLRFRKASFSSQRYWSLTLLEPAAIGAAGLTPPASIYNGELAHREYSAYQENTMSENPLAEPQRKEIFLALVEAQDRGITVTESRKEVAERFGMSEIQVRTIEREGLDKRWPPL